MARIKSKYIEGFYRTGWEELLKTLYLKDGMSSYEIAERIHQDTGIEYTSRAVRKWLLKLGILRDHAEALKNRVLTGRMDYAKRKTDYKGIFIDYGAMWRQRGLLWAAGLKDLLKNKGDTKRLAGAIGADPTEVSCWKYLRRRVSFEYQEKICSYFGFEKSKIFSETKNLEYPKFFVGKGVDQRKWFIKRGYCYAPELKAALYAKGRSLSDLAQDLNKPMHTISKWCSGGLISPADQERIKRFLKDPCDKVFNTHR